MSGAAFLVGLGAMTAPAMIVVAITTAGFLTAGAVLVARSRARAHAHRPESPPVDPLSGLVSAPTDQGT
ncbi:hypothetical protein [Rhodococcus wratislaviensis]|uniref:hypothetical protein n=1 Tax=Rhodococcus wratislaviensis TaxID=44752 RepID=UPI00365D4E46